MRREGSRETIKTNTDLFEVAPKLSPKSDVKDPGDIGITDDDLGVDRRRADSTAHGRRRRVDYMDTDGTRVECGVGRRRAGSCCYRRRQTMDEVSKECVVNDQDP